jgi:hypothetical protein
VRPRYAVLLTEAELIALGRELAKNPSAVTGNIEGLALITYRDSEKRKKIARDGCCGEGASADGYCWGIGLCPRFVEAGRLERFARGFLEWLDELEDESALAAIAARLSVSSPVSELESTDV